MKRFIRSIAIIFLLILAVSLLARHLWFNANHIHLVPKITYNDQSPLTKELDPQLCTHENRTIPSHSPDTSHSAYTISCPPHHAFYGNIDPGADLEDDEGRYVKLYSTCCPLPAKDILTEDHIYGIEQSCPENYVATGGSEYYCGSHCAMRCTRINTEKYRLGPKQKSFYWRVEWKIPSAGRGFTKQIRFRNIPAAIRGGLGRTADLTKTETMDDCIGIPFGSLLVEKNSNDCAGFFYQQLFFRESGEAVRMFPDCADVIDGQCISPVVGDNN